MRGSLKQRYKGSWSLILDLGYEIDPAAGTRKRKQKWITFHGTRKQAEQKLTDLVGKADRHEFVEPTKLTLGAWLDTWLEKAIKPPKRRPRTYDNYRQQIEKRVKPALGHVPLQQLTALDVERYYAESDLAPSSLHVHQVILSSALKSALKTHLVYRNIAADVEGKPRIERQADDLIARCWSVDEARAFLAVAAQQSGQAAAFYALALNSGARKGELLGLQWKDIDFEQQRLRIVRQLLDSGMRKRKAARGTISEPAFGPPKNRASVRTIDVASEVLHLLRAHKRAQAELKMQNRTTYRDFDLVFAREWMDVHGDTAALGLPLSIDTLGRRLFTRLTTVAGVRRIPFHGLRHTCASLLLEAGEPMKVVQERLGHAKISVTMDTYSHVAVGMQARAATRLGSLLHG